MQSPGMKHMHCDRKVKRHIKTILFFIYILYFFLQEIASIIKKCKGTTQVHRMYAREPPN
jgi:hypothetical protein